MTNDLEKTLRDRAIRRAEQDGLSGSDRYPYAVGVLSVELAYAMRRIEDLEADLHRINQHPDFEQAMTTVTIEAEILREAAAMIDGLTSRVTWPDIEVTELREQFSLEKAMVEALYDAADPGTSVTDRPR